MAALPEPALAKALGLISSTPAAYYSQHGLDTQQQKEHRLSPPATLVTKKQGVEKTSAGSPAFLHGDTRLLSTVPPSFTLLSPNLDKSRLEC